MERYAEHMKVALIDADLAALASLRDAVTGPGGQGAGAVEPSTVVLGQNAQDGPRLVQKALGGDAPVTVAVIALGDAPGYSGIAAMGRIHAIDPGVQFLALAAAPSDEIERRLAEAVPRRQVCLLFKPVKPQSIRLNVQAAHDRWRFENELALAHMSARARDAVAVADLDVPAFGFDRRGRLRATNAYARDLYANVADAFVPGARVETLRLRLAEAVLNGGGADKDANAQADIRWLATGQAVFVAECTNGEGEEYWFHFDASGPVARERRASAGAVVHEALQQIGKLAQPAHQAADATDRRVVSLTQSVADPHAMQEARRSLLVAGTTAKPVAIDLADRLGRLCAYLAETRGWRDNISLDVADFTSRVDVPAAEFDAAVLDLIDLALDGAATDVAVRIAVSSFVPGRQHAKALGLSQARHVRLRVEVDRPRTAYRAGEAVFVPCADALSGRGTTGAACAYVLADLLGGALSVTGDDTTSRFDLMLQAAPDTARVGGEGRVEKRATR